MKKAVSKPRTVVKDFHEFLMKDGTTSHRQTFDMAFQTKNIDYIL
jgi:hypothetical protein